MEFADGPDWISISKCRSNLLPSHKCVFAITIKVALNAIEVFRFRKFHFCHASGPPITKILRSASFPVLVPPRAAGWGCPCCSARLPSPGGLVPPLPRAALVAYIAGCPGYLAGLFRLSAGLDPSSGVMGSFSGASNCDRRKRSQALSRPGATVSWLPKCPQVTTYPQIMGRFRKGKIQVGYHEKCGSPSPRPESNRRPLHQITVPLSPLSYQGICAAPHPEGEGERGAAKRRESRWPAPVSNWAAAFTGGPDERKKRTIPTTS